uniref:Putative secreted protein n=1 Tax=Panstrongylus lignarius TaxID=156445 RepID=A0A224Y5U6_9HEMI
MAVCERLVVFFLGCLEAHPAQYHLPRGTLLNGGFIQSVWNAIGHASQTSKLRPTFLPQTIQFFSPFALFKH